MEWWGVMEYCPPAGSQMRNSITPILQHPSPVLLRDNTLGTNVSFLHP